MMTDRPLRIAVDMDSTLADLYAVVLPLLNFKHAGRGSLRTFDRALTAEDIRSWDTLKEKGVNDDFYAILDMLNDLNLRRAIPPTSPLAPGVVKWLVKRGHTVEVLTANPTASEPSMRAWLFGHGLDLPVHALGRVHATEKLTATTLTEPHGPYDLFLDDSPHLALAFREQPPERRLLLVDQPWNRATMDVNRVADNPRGNVWRLTRWEDACRLLEVMGA